MKEARNNLRDNIGGKAIGRSKNARETNSKDPFFVGKGPGQPRSLKQIVQSKPLPGKLGGASSGTYPRDAGNLLNRMKRGR